MVVVDGEVQQPGLLADEVNGVQQMGARPAKHNNKADDKGSKMHGAGFEETDLGLAALPILLYPEVLAS